MNTPGHVTSLALVIVLTTACDRSPAGRTDAVTRDSAGISIVESDNATWDSTTAWRVSAEPLLHLDAAASGKGAEFTYLRGALRLGNGTIVVLEGPSNETRWFDANGRHIATRGGKGKGPGEFVSASQLIATTGDTVIVQDAPRIKLVLYSSDGSLIREEFLDGARYRERGKWLECLTLTLPDRSLIGCQEEKGLQAGWYDRVGMQRSFARFRRVPWSLDSVYSLGIHAGLEQFGIKDGSHIRYAAHPYHARTYIAGGGNPLRIAIARNPEYSIEMWTPEGTLERIVRRRDAREHTAPEAIAELNEQMRWLSFGDKALFNRMVAETPIPDTVPAIWDLAVGDDGDLWVKRGRGVAADSTRYDVFNRNGQFLGEIRLPPRTRIYQVGADFLLTSTLDEDDVPSVEVYALSRGSPKLY